MFHRFDSMAGHGPEQQNGSTFGDSPGGRSFAISPRRAGPGFSKIFRWQPSDPLVVPPDSVELVGSFTGWQPIGLVRDAVTHTWQVTLHGIAGNRTHRYMILVNGEPANDRNSDGLAIPECPEEQRFQLMTARGPRVFLLFAQAK